MDNPTEPILNANEYYVTHIKQTALYCILLVPLLIPLISHKLHLRKNPRPKGCRKLGLPPNKSNLHDEYHPKYSQPVPETDTDTPSWRIKALFAYPIKSCTGIELDVADIVPTGFTYDRQFCFAEYITPKTNANSQQPHWTVRTLRDGDLCRLALIKPEIWVPDPTAPDYSPSLDEVQSHGVMVIHYPRVPQSLICKISLALGLLPKHQSFSVPFLPKTTHSYPSAPLKVWKDFPPSYNYAIHLPPSLHHFLDPHSTRGPLSLFRANPSHPRQIFRNAPRKPDLGFQPVTGFADAYPIHLLSLSSVQHVAAKCRPEIPHLSIRRFRANMIIQGPGPFEEDGWKRIRVSDVDMYTACRTIRCRLPNVDPDTGVRHPSQPDRTLKAYRRIDRGDLTNAALGMQVVPALRECRIRVGDRIQVLETGEHCYIKMLKPGEVVEGV
ncbi:MOSC-domain-containing protein [Aspergillus avenaceus]|uniref:MOSC-domain-containing protein n=1 Tax=Aspergillus avenaceus TaxID=36643 RepID=A0A5N6THP0_ASPAV|nr:MOSC-domain-containing protein [Aspergillus avenaceus]